MTGEKNAKAFYEDCERSSELQETGMYDYGARFYMPDIGRFGTIDQRSQYTHEAYSYVWNNPIYFTDPTGMSGEIFDTCDTCPKTNAFKKYIDDKENDYDYDPETNTVSRVTPIEAVVVTGYNAIKTAAAAAVVTGYQISRASWAFASTGLSSLGSGLSSGLGVLSRVSLWTLPLMLNGDSSRPKNVIPPPPYFNIEKEEESDDTDVNGQEVPNEKKGGGKNAQHKNQKAKQSAGEKHEEAKAEYERLKSKPGKTKQDAKLRDAAEKQMKHWKKKADETGENHSRNAKGTR